MYANKFTETMPRAAMTQLQTQQLNKIVHWAYEKTSFYRRKFDQAGIAAEAIKTLADLEKLPFTTREELEAESPFEFLTGPLSTTIRLRQESSGIVRAYTNDDVGRNVEMVTRALVAGGISGGSLVGLMGGQMEAAVLDVQYAAEVLGATVVPLGADCNQALRMLEQFGVDTLVSDPAKLLQLIITGAATGQDLRNLPLRSCFCLNEMVANPLAEYLESRSGATIYDLYVSRDLGCTGMMFSCPQKGGMHIAEDYFYPEAIAFGSDVPAAAGQIGELVVTALAQQAMPVLRYRTGQAVILRQDDCSCGRTAARIWTPLAKVR